MKREVGVPGAFHPALPIVAIPVKTSGLDGSDSPHGKAVLVSFHALKGLAQHLL
jgi:hypothetical protein